MGIRKKIASFLSWTMEALGLATKNLTAPKVYEDKTFVKPYVPVNVMQTKDVHKKNIERHEQHK